MASKNLSFVLTGIDQSASATLGAVGLKGENTASKVSGAFSKMGSMLGGEFGELGAKIGEVFGSAGEESTKMGTKVAAAGAAITGIGAILTNMGSADKQAQDQLAQAIDNTGNSFSDYKEEIEKAIGTQENFGHSAVDTQNALMKLTTATNDPEKALEDMGVVADLAAAKHEALGDAATQVARVLSGTGGKTLAQYGIVMQNTGDKTVDAQNALDELAGKLNGQASASMDNWSSKVDIAKTKLEDYAAKIGEKLGPALTVAGPLLMALGAAMDIVSARAAKNAAAQAASAAATEADAAATSQLTVAAEAASVSEGELTAATEAQTTAAGASTAANSGLLATLGRLGVVGAAAAAGAAVEAEGYKQAKEAADKHGKAMGALSIADGLFTMGSSVVATKIADVIKGHDKATTSAKKLQQATKDLTVTTQGMTIAEQSGVTWTNAYDNAIKELTGTALSAAQTDNSFRDSVASLTAAVQQAKDAHDKNATSLDNSTVAGRANNEAVLAAIQAADGHAAAVFKQTNSVDAANAALAADEKAITAAGVAAGLNSTQIAAMIKQYGGVPGTISTQVQLDTSSAYASLNNYIAAINTAGLGLGSTARSQIPNYTGESISHAAGGVIGGQTFDEAGLEALNLPNGTTVIPHGQTQQMLRGGGAAPVQIHITLQSWTGPTAEDGKKLVEAINLAAAQHGVGPLRAPWLAA